MKQQITKEQWNELNGNQKSKFWPDDWKHTYNPKDGFQEVLPNIGQMIEFLGDDLGEMQHHSKGYTLLSVLFGQIEDNELCDALWEAVKNKLNS